MKNSFLKIVALFCAVIMIISVASCTIEPGDGLDSLGETTVDEADSTSEESTPGASDESTTDASEDVSSTEGESTTDNTEDKTTEETSADTSSTESSSTEKTTEEQTTEPDKGGYEDSDVPKDNLLLIGAEDLRKANPSSLSIKLQSDSSGMKFAACTPKAADPWFIFAGGSKREENAGGRYLYIKYRTENLDQGRIYVATRNFSESGAVGVTYINDGQWHIMKIDLARSAEYSKEGVMLRFDPMDGVSTDEKLDIAWVALCAGGKDGTEGLPDLPEDSPNLNTYKRLNEGTYYKTSTVGSNNTYSFKDGFMMSVYRRGYFNKYSISYSSTQPIQGTITYLMWNENGGTTTRSETFYLEAGNGLTFSSLIDDYFLGEYAYGIDGVSLRSCNGENASFTISSISTSTEEVAEGGTYYLEGDRYKIGVLISWGGGISYIEDKNDGDPQITNLINRADTGRLVQQSYYGIQNGGGYTAEQYNGTLWRYNPVQGGDVYNNGSKIIDFQISDDGRSMYIKCRPMDWAKRGFATPSYMENWYTVEDNAIRVKNRFIDFMGVDHPVYDQELPAFYTISYLGTFHYYNGTRPWTGDAYETLPNEGFWGGNDSAYHQIVNGNTETWAAWTNGNDYGIGIYVPGVVKMLAGRHMYNGSKDPSDGATSYVAPLGKFNIVSYKPFSYEYVIACGSISDMRAVFASYKDVLNK